MFAAFRIPILVDPDCVPPQVPRTPHPPEVAWVPLPNPLPEITPEGKLPPIPYRLEGPDSVAVWDTCEFSTFCGPGAGVDSLMIRFSWGDGHASAWSPAQEPGTPIKMTHAWQKPGRYSIMARSRFPDGDSSDWSVPYIVAVTGLR